LKSRTTNSIFSPQSYYYVQNAYLAAKPSTVNRHLSTKNDKPQTPNRKL